MNFLRCDLLEFFSFFSEPPLANMWHSSSSVAFGLSLNLPLFPTIAADSIGPDSVGYHPGHRNTPPKRFLFKNYLLSCFLMYFS